MHSQKNTKKVKFKCSVFHGVQFSVCGFYSVWHQAASLGADLYRRKLLQGRNVPKGGGSLDLRNDGIDMQCSQYALWRFISYLRWEKGNSCKLLLFILVPPGNSEIAAQNRPWLSVSLTLHCNWLYCSSAPYNLSYWEDRLINNK